VEEVKPTIKGRLILNSSEDRAWLLLLMRNFRDAVEYSHSLLRDGLNDAEIVKLLTSRILNNANYSYSALQRAKLYQDQPYLKLKKPQLFSVADLLPVLKSEASLQELRGSPHLFGTTSVICGAVGVARDPPICFRAFFSMFITAITSLSASNPHIGHFIFL